jgi:hypothetical protein
MLDRVQLGATTPRHYKEALRLLAFARRVDQKDLVDQALAAFLGPQMLAEALDAARSHRR